MSEIERLRRKITGDLKVQKSKKTKTVETSGVIYEKDRKGNKYRAWYRATSGSRVFIKYFQTKNEAAEWALFKLETKEAGVKLSDLAGKVKLAEKTKKKSELLNTSHTEWAEKENAKDLLADIAAISERVVEIETMFKPKITVYNSQSTYTVDELKALGLLPMDATSENALSLLNGTYIHEYKENDNFSLSLVFLSSISLVGALYGALTYLVNYL